jgi:hypothetical protein
MAHVASELAERPTYTFEQTHPADREAVAVAIALCWFGLLAGFIPDMVRQFGAGHSYVLSAHLHAASAIGWMALLSWQALKVRSGAMVAHRRDGRRFGPVLAAILVTSALVTVWTADRAAAATQGAAFNPARLSIQLGHIIPFAVLTAVALTRTDRPALHKRLLLLAVFAILDTGWSRWLFRDLTTVLGEGLPLQLLGRFPLTWAMMAGMALFDYRTRGRLHPAFLPAAGLILATEAVSIALLFTPGWAPIARKLLGI